MLKFPGMKEFDSREWQKAYNQAALEEAVESGDPGAIRAPLEQVLHDQGITGRVRTIDEALAWQEQQEYNQDQLIAAELGERPVVRITGEQGQRTIRLRENPTSWDVFKGLAAAYAERGDTPSVQQLISIFDPSNSQLRTQVVDQISSVVPNPGYEGYDPSVGPITSIEVGDQFDMEPGLVDFRTATNEETGIDVEALTQRMLQSQQQHSDPETGQADWSPLNQTLDNLKLAYGSEIRRQVWKTFEQKYESSH